MSVSMKLIAPGVKVKLGRLMDAEGMGSAGVDKKFSEQEAVVISKRSKQGCGTRITVEVRGEQTTVMPRSIKDIVK